MKTLGLLAGGGELPAKIIAHCQQKNIPSFVIAFPGQTDPALVNGHPHEWIPLGSVGQTLACLKARGVTHIVMAGAMHRPSWSEIKLDWTGTRWLAKMGAKALGDDGLLSGLASLLKAEGFEMISAPDILDDLLASEGVMGLHQPDEADWQDIGRGIEILRSLGAADVGQAVVVQQGLVLGVEAIEGTQALLVRCGTLRREGRGGTLVKMAKPQQSRIADLPTIGESTIHQAQAIGLRGIAIEAGATQILDRDNVLKAANAAGLYLVGVSAHD